MSTSAVALVVGGSRGIGQSVAMRLARAGYGVIVVGRDPERLTQLERTAQAEALRLMTVSVDICDAEQSSSALDKAAAAFGSPTVFVHAAAAMYRHQRLHFMSEQEADRLLNTDLRSAIHLTRWVLPAMSAAGYGRIIYLGSLAARIGIPGAALYASAKAGLEGLCRGVALDYAKRGITANTLSIGVAASERMLERTASDEAKQAALLAKIATGRFVEPEEIAETVLFLCSEHARSITGSVIDITGGAHLNV